MNRVKCSSRRRQTIDRAPRVRSAESEHFYGVHGTVSGSCALDDVYAIQTNRNRRKPELAQPTRPQRPGWVTYTNETTDVCFECFGLSHNKPRCPHLSKTYFDPRFPELETKAYHLLTPQQKNYLQRTGLTPAFDLESNPKPETHYPPAPSMPSVQLALSFEAGFYRSKLGLNRDILSILHSFLQRH